MKKSRALIAAAALLISGCVTVVNQTGGGQKTTATGDGQVQDQEATVPTSRPSSRPAFRQDQSGGTRVDLDVAK